jgi:hypothetical protein
MAGTSQDEPAMTVQVAEHPNEVADRPVTDNLLLKREIAHIIFG